MKPWLSVCIAIKNRSAVHTPQGVLELFPNCVRSLQTAADTRPGIQLVIADYYSDDVDIPSWLSASRRPGLDVLYARVPGHFSRGGGLSLAARSATSDILFLCDADMLATIDALSTGWEHAVRGDAAFPSSVHLSPAGEPMFVDGGGYGLSFVSKELFLKAGGLPPFRSWGGEDWVFRDRVSRHTNVQRYVEEGLRHQWHPEDIKHKYYVRPAGADQVEFRRKGF